MPCNVIAEEILTDHPERLRAMLIESSNPAHSLADSERFREALDALDLVVVIDVAMTETARHADYVLPAASQYEKWEATFFNLEFPRNTFHLRAPLLDPLPGHAARAGDPRAADPRAGRDRRGRSSAPLRAAAAEGRARVRRRRFGEAVAARPGARRAAALRALRDARADAARRAWPAPPRCGGSRSAAR